MISVSFWYLRPGWTSISVIGLLSAGKINWIDFLFFKVGPFFSILLNHERQSLNTQFKLDGTEQHWQAILSWELFEYDHKPCYQEVSHGLARAQQLCLSQPMPVTICTAWDFGFLSPSPHHWESVFHMFHLFHHAGSAMGILALADVLYVHGYPLDYKGEKQLIWLK